MIQLKSHIPIFLLLAFGLLSSCLSQNTKPTSEIPCGDLLEKYAEKPQTLEFIECKRGQGQTKLEATYKVAGKDSLEVEEFFMQKYGMGKLSFLCCGWEPTNGKKGWVKSKRLKNYDLEISMWGNGEKKNQDESLEIEQDRNKIMFSVTARVLDI